MACFPQSNQHAPCTGLFDHRAWMIHLGHAVCFSFSDALIQDTRCAPLNRCPTFACWDCTRSPVCNPNNFVEWEKKMRAELAAIALRKAELAVEEAAAAQNAMDDKVN